MTTVLTLNGGSSSIRFALYDSGDLKAKRTDGKIERIGVSGTFMRVRSDCDGKMIERNLAIDALDHRSVIDYLLDYLEAQGTFTNLGGVGHRVVHGMAHSHPSRVTPELLEELRRMLPYDPEHLPRELELIDGVCEIHPEIPQVACFDTAFHSGMPRVATILPIPRRFEAQGLRRYGFHGLSYTYLMNELERLGDPAATRGCVILAHLGNGASLAAIRDGRCIDTSMGFTPTAGLVMSTRTGDLDPGVFAFLTAVEGMDVKACQRMVTHEAGLLGVSETSSDIRDLLGRELGDFRAAEAVDVFCYQVRKWIGSFSAALGGLDTLVFAGGIGENSGAVRTRICAGLEFLGVELDDDLNAHDAAVISSGARHVAVRVVHTDEESVIAGMTLGVLAAGTPIELRTAAV